MNRKERFNKYKEIINLKYSYIKLIDNRDYFKFKEKVEWKCSIHNCIFISSIDTLLNNYNTCGCPICRKEKLYTSPIKDVDKRKKLRGE